MKKLAIALILLFTMGSLTTCKLTEQQEIKSSALDGLNFYDLLQSSNTIT